MCQLEEKLANHYLIRRYLQDWLAICAGIDKDRAVGCPLWELFLLPGRKVWASMSTGTLGTVHTQKVIDSSLACSVDLEQVSNVAECIHATTWKGFSFNRPSLPLFLLPGRKVGPPCASIYSEMWMPREAIHGSLVLKLIAWTMYPI